MRIVTKNITSDENDGWAEYAIIFIGDDARKEILEAKELWQMVKSKNPSLDDLRFWDARACHFSCYDEEEAFVEHQRKELEEKGYFILSDAVEIEDENDFDIGGIFEGAEWSRTDCDRLVVDEHGFYWFGAHKHTSDWVETQRLPFELVV